MPGLKVIGGSLKGTPLVSPRGLAVRPTAAKVREAIGSILQPHFSDAVVLDLFAGTGALGIEALSRGARFAVFVDNHPRSLAIIKNNINNCGIAAKTQTLLYNPVRDLNCLVKTEKHFDLVFMDPPYGKKAVPDTLANLHTSDALTPGAIIVVEQSAQETGKRKTEGHPGGEAQWTSHFSLTSRRKYGKTLVTFLAYMVK